MEVFKMDPVQMEAIQWWTVPVPRSLVTDVNLAPGARHLYMVLRALALADAARRSAAGTAGRAADAAGRSAAGTAGRAADAARRSAAADGDAEASQTLRLSSEKLLRLCGLGNRAVLGRYTAGLVRGGWVQIVKGAGQRPTGYRLTVPPGASPRTVRVPASLIGHRDLPVTAKVLYATLLAHRTAGAQAAVCPRLKLISLAGIGDDNTVRTALRRLSEADWLRVERNAKLKMYRYEPRDPHLLVRQTEQHRADMRLTDAPHLGERLMQHMLTTLIADADYADNVRPSILINPLTGDPLEFDRWYRTARIAFEFNGPQHTGPTKMFPDVNKAKRQIIRDLLKEGLAAKHGIHLIDVVPTELTFQQLINKIGDLLPLRTLQAEDPLVAYLDRTSRRYIRNVRKGRA